MFKNLFSEVKIQGGNSSNDTLSKKLTHRKIYNKLNVSHLVSLDDFKDYFNSGNIIFNDYTLKKKNNEMMNAIYLVKKRFKAYQAPESNKQFISVYKSDIYNQNRLNEMLVFFVGDMWKKIINTMIDHNQNDDYILNIIVKNINIQSDIHSKIYKVNKICDLIIRYLSNVDNNKPSILDIGIGSGKKTKQIKNIIENCDIYGADIEQWGPYKIKEKNFDFTVKTIKQNPYRIPYPNKKFDCITLILTLHHSENPMEVINECKRMLKDDGILVLVEHDVWSDELNMIIDIQHRIFKSLNKENDKYFAKYYNFYEWDIIFDKCGMQSILGRRLQEDASYRIRYDAQYISFYKKKMTS